MKTNQARFAVGEEYLEGLDELGRLYGHNSRSQTVEFILREHLNEELEIARELEAIRTAKRARKR